MIRWAFGYDPTPLGLPEDRGEPDARDAVEVEEVAEHGARPHARELVRVTDQHQGRWERDSLDEMTHQLKINHAPFVYDDNVGFKWVLPVAEELTLRILEQLMHRARVTPGDLAEALGRTAGRGGEVDSDPPGLEDLDQRVQDGGLAGAGPSGDHHNLLLERQPHRFSLLRR